jgi:hypothetical protein
MQAILVSVTHILTHPIRHNSTAGIDEYIEDLTDSLTWWVSKIETTSDRAHNSPALTAGGRRDAEIAGI